MMRALVRRFAALLCVMGCFGVAIPCLAQEAAPVVTGQDGEKAILYQATACWECPGVDPVCYIETDPDRAKAISKALTAANNHNPNDPDCMLVLQPVKRIETIAGAAVEKSARTGSCVCVATAKCVACNCQKFTVKAEGATRREALCWARQDAHAAAQIFGGLKCACYSVCCQRVEAAPAPEAK